MDEIDIAVRNVTYQLFVRLGSAPTLDDVADSARLAASDIAASWRRLHDAHALVLQPTTGAIRMANPFSAVPTPYRVQTGARSWFANCAWDAFGICAALGVDGRIETTCPDCGDPIQVRVEGQQPDDLRLLFHCLVPARKWWDDIGFT